MGKLDEISRALGRLEASVETLVKQAEKHDEHTEQIKANLGALTRTVEPIAASVKAMEPHVAHYAQVRRFGGWVVGVVTPAVALGVSLAARWVEKKWFS